MSLKKPKPSAPSATPPNPKSLARQLSRLLRRLVLLRREREGVEGVGKAPPG